MEFDQRRCATRQRRLAEAAALLVDPRLADVWGALWSWEEAARGARPEVGPAESAADHPRWSEETIATLLRMAYLQGYGDALADEPGALFRALGVRPPGPASDSRH